MTFKADGKVIDRDVRIWTKEDVEAKWKENSAAAENRRIVVKVGTVARPLDQFPPGYSFGENVDFKTIPGGTIKGAEDVRARYITAQVAAVAEVLGERYGQTVQLDQGLRFVVIPSFRLPPRWGLKTTPILIWFPRDYPTVPPHGFYLSNRCIGSHILRANVYGDSPDLSDRGWNWYCVNAGKGWRPNADPLEQDNLWTFLDVVRTSLSIEEF